MELCVKYYVRKRRGEGEGGVYVFICIKSFLRDFKLLQGVPVGRKEFSSDGRKFFHVCRTS